MRGSALKEVSIPYRLEDIVENFHHLGVEFEEDIGTLWITLKYPSKPCLSIELINEFNELSSAIQAEHGRHSPSSRQVLKFVVLKSASPAVFNLGGDLNHFVAAINGGSCDTLRAYGRAGAAACHDLAWGFGASAVTISLVRGIALGGGFEAARCCNIMLAEQGATFQLPEAGFGLFPASGVISVMSPRIGHKATRRLVIDGERLTCSDALAADVIDAVVPVGEGCAKVRELIAYLTPRHAASVATYAGLNRTAGVTMDALMAEVELWATSAMELTRDNLSMMRRLSRAQERRFQTEALGG